MYAKYSFLCLLICWDFYFSNPNLVSLIAWNSGPLLNLPFNKDIFRWSTLPLNSSNMYCTYYMFRRAIGDFLFKQTYIPNLQKLFLPNSLFYTLKTCSRWRKLQENLLCGVFLVRSRWCIMMVLFSFEGNSPISEGDNCSSTVWEGDNYRNADRIMRVTWPTW